jgi:hypothetical protein
VSDLAEAVRAETAALLSTPGAFAEWDRRVQTIGWCGRWMLNASGGNERRAFGHYMQAIEGANAYAAEVRREFEADVIARALKSLGVDPYAVDEAVRDALRVEP